jgi:hypothetical protein
MSIVVRNSVYYNSISRFAFAFPLTRSRSLSVLSQQQLTTPRFVLAHDIPLVLFPPCPNTTPVRVHQVRLFFLGLTSKLRSDHV